MRTSRIDWCGILIVLIMTLALAAMSFLAIMPIKSQNICFADSSNGIVEDNLLPLEYLSNGTYSSTQNLNDYFRVSLGTSNNLVIINNQSIEFSSSVSSGGWSIVQYMGTLSAGTYTMSAYLSEYTDGAFRMNVNNGAIATSSAFSSVGVCTLTFTLTSSCSDFRFYANNSNLKIDWIKIEVGSSFTGYVPRDYQNYGYQQGYNDAVQKFVDYSSTINGYTIVGSYSEWLQNNFLTNDNFSMTASYWGSNTTSYQQNALINNNALTFVTIGSPAVSFGFGTSSLSQPQYVSIMNYTASSGYEFTVTTTPSGANYCCAIPIALNVLYLNTNLYFSFDFNDFNSYSLLITTNDFTYYKMISITSAFSYINGVPYIPLSTYLSSGQYYNFYLCSRTTNTGFTLTTHNSYFTGINSLSIFYKEDSYSVGANSYQMGYDDGYDLGYSRGYTEGDNAGYIRGVDSASEYGFYGLIGSAIDVPISAITGLLDFELLGVNMKAFFLSIFSLAVLIVIVRLIVGGLS